MQWTRGCLAAGLALLTLACDPTVPPPTGESGNVPASSSDTGESSSDGPIPTCGNGALDPGEECDGELLAGQTCEVLVPATLPWLDGGGTLSCSDTCTFDTSQCHECGNGVLDPGEECDGTDFGGQTCADYDAWATVGTPICMPNLCMVAENVGCCIPSGNQCAPGNNNCCSGGCPYDLWPMVCL